MKHQTEIAYDDLISPLLMEIHEIAVKNRIPIFCAFGIIIEDPDLLGTSAPATAHRTKTFGDPNMAEIEELFEVFGGLASGEITFTTSGPPDAP